MPRWPGFLRLIRGGRVRKKAKETAASVPTDSLNPASKVRTVGRLLTLIKGKKIPHSARRKSTAKHTVKRVFNRASEEAIRGGRAVWSGKETEELHRLPGFEERQLLPKGTRITPTGQTLKAVPSRKPKKKKKD